MGTNFIPLRKQRYIIFLKYRSVILSILILLSAIPFGLAYMNEQERVILRDLQSQLGIDEFFDERQGMLQNSIDRENSILQVFQTRGKLYSGLTSYIAENLPGLLWISEMGVYRAENPDNIGKSTATDIENVSYHNLTPEFYDKQLFVIRGAGTSSVEVGMFLKGLQNSGYLSHVNLASLQEVIIDNNYIQLFEVYGILTESENKDVQKIAQ